MTVSTLSTDTIGISNLLLQLSIQVHQPVLLSLSINHATVITASSDNLSHSIDYAALCDILLKILPAKRYASLESVTNEAASVVFSEHPQVTELHIRIQQVKSPMYVDNIAVQSSRKRSQDTASSPNSYDINGLRCDTIVGINPNERIHRQPVCFDIALRDSSKKQTIGFDFEKFAQTIRHRVAETSFLTLEALASFVAESALTFISHQSDGYYCENVTIIASKPNALPHAEAAQIKIARSRTDYPSIAGSPSNHHSTDTHIAAIALGSNLGDRFANIEGALRLLESSEEANREVYIIDTSFMYETAPMYVTDQPRFVNCACMIETTLKPKDLLSLLKKIEHTVGRVPSIRNGPRAVDLDVILYDQVCLDTRAESDRKNLDNLEGELVIPHPRMVEREFVLRPLADMIPNYVHPVYRKSVSTLLTDVLSVTPVDDPPMVKVMPFPRYPLPATSQEPLLAPPTASHWALPPALSTAGTPIGNARSRPPTRIMATLNATPDSFSDGSLHSEVPAALTYVSGAIDAGADVIDVGGYSTRPGAAFVSVEEEIERVVPVVKAIRARSTDPEERADKERYVLISVDTFRHEVARAAILAGANCINDVYAFTGADSYPLTPASLEHLEKMKAVARELAVPVVLMHSRGDAGSNKDYSSFVGGVLEGIQEELGYKVDKVVRGRGGVRRWLVICDPGVGFSKTVEANLAVLRQASSITHIQEGNLLAGYPMLIGTSRKSFLGAILQRNSPEAGRRGRNTQPRERVWATAAAVACAIQQGSAVVRVHDVQEMVDVVSIGDALWG